MSPFYRTPFCFGVWSSEAAVPPGKYLESPIYFVCDTRFLMETHLVKQSYQLLYIKEQTGHLQNDYSLSIFLLWIPLCAKDYQSTKILIRGKETVMNYAWSRECLGHFNSIRWDVSAATTFAVAPPLLKTLPFPCIIHPKRHCAFAAFPISSVFAVNSLYTTNCLRNRASPSLCYIQSSNRPSFPFPALWKAINLLLPCNWRSISYYSPCQVSASSLQQQG